MGKEYDLEHDERESQEEHEGAGWQTIGLFIIGLVLLLYVVGMF